MTRLFLSFLIAIWFTCTAAFQPRVTLSATKHNNHKVGGRQQQQVPLVAPTVPVSATAASDDSSSSSSSSQPFTKARLHNQSWFRSAAILSALTLAGIKSPIPASTSATLHLLAFGTFIGTVIYTTFIAGITMFKNLPRQTFGRLQSKLFPKYFNLCSISVVLQVRRSCRRGEIYTAN